MADPTERRICKKCGTDIHWIACPTGGWWAHATHPTDNHDAELSINPWDANCDECRQLPHASFDPETGRFLCVVCPQMGDLTWPFATL